MTTILDKILAAKKGQVEQMLLGSIPEQLDIIARPSLFDALYQTEKLQVISEIKRASPSKGLIAEGIIPAEQATQYADAGAACISVLTDTPFFQGTFDDLAEVASTVSIPILCKDFIIHPIQIDHAKHGGASVVLLIAAALKQEQFLSLYEYAVSKGLEVLVEVHDSVELDRALQLDAKLIGVNNRDLRRSIGSLSPPGDSGPSFPFEEKRVLISESGIWNAADAIKVANYGASAVLVGESLMRSGDVQNALQSLQVQREVITS